MFVITALAWSVLKPPSARATTLMSGYLAMTSAKPFSRCAAATIPAMPSRSTILPLGVPYFAVRYFTISFTGELAAFGMIHAVGGGDRRHNMIIRDLLGRAIVRIGDQEFVAELLCFRLHALNDPGDGRIRDRVSRVSDCGGLSRFSSQSFRRGEANRKNGSDRSCARPTASRPASHFVSSPHRNTFCC